ncbi:MAG: hypothetical protein ACYCXW_06850 [Solirubrobacteraceae bacterium]
MGVLWTMIASGALAAGAIVALLTVRDGTLAACAGTVLVVALGVLSRATIRLASDPARAPRQDDDH